MRYECQVFGDDPDVEFFFPRWGAGVRYLAVCGYFRGRQGEDCCVYVGGPAVRHVEMGHRYIHTVPAAGVRHAAATGDPSLLIDWLLENACDTRPWLAEAIDAALAGGEK